MTVGAPLRPEASLTLTENHTVRRTTILGGDLCVQDVTNQLWDGVLRPCSESSILNTLSVPSVLSS